jgi:hypothetical protein
LVSMAILFGLGWCGWGVSRPRKSTYEGAV